MCVFLFFFVEKPAEEIEELQDENKLSYWKQILFLF